MKITRRVHGQTGSIPEMPVKSGFRQVREVGIVLSQNVGGLNRSMQHWLAVYSPGFESPRSLAGVD